MSVTWFSNLFSIGMDWPMAIVGFLAPNFKKKQINYCTQNMLHCAAYSISINVLIRMKEKDSAGWPRPWWDVKNWIHFRNLGLDLKLIYTKYSAIWPQPRWCTKYWIEIYSFQTAWLEFETNLHKIFSFLTTTAMVYQILK